MSPSPSTVRILESRIRYLEGERRAIEIKAERRAFEIDQEIARLDLELRALVAAGRESVGL